MSRREKKEWRRLVDEANRKQRELMDAGKQSFWMEPPLHLIDHPTARAAMEFMGMVVTKPGESP